MNPSQVTTPQTKSPRLVAQVSLEELEGLSEADQGLLVALRQIHLRLQACRQHPFDPLLGEKPPS